MHLCIYAQTNCAGWVGMGRTNFVQKSRILILRWKFPQKLCLFANAVHRHALRQYLKRNFIKRVKMYFDMFYETQSPVLIFFLSNKLVTLYYGGHVHWFWNAPLLKNSAAAIMRHSAGLRQRLFRSACLSIQFGEGLELFCIHLFQTEKK